LSKQLSICWSSKEGKIMKNNLNHEFYKFWHQRIPLYGLATLCILMLYSAVSESGVSKMMIAHGFALGQWVTIIMIAIASTFIVMEYQNNTIITLFYKSSNKSSIYFAKLIVVVSYGTLLVAVGILLTFVLKVLFIGNRYSWEVNYGQHTLIANLFFNVAGSLLYMIFIVTLAFFLISLIRANAVVVGIGLAMGFFGSGLSNFVMSALPGFSDVIKWNPLNMINIINQLSNSRMTQFSSLSDMELVIGNIVYSVIFVIIGDMVFKCRHV
jgi:ABC-2 type transport system permease protein